MAIFKFKKSISVIKKLPHLIPRELLYNMYNKSLYKHNHCSDIICDQPFNVFFGDYTIGFSEKPGPQVLNLVDGSHVFNICINLEINQINLLT